ncbi:glycosyltransferase family 2 protein [Nakamurella flava]|uniref:Glycosyltransferase family 2 protein n=1 Tax=Nakamurella flava TaxID=2576308 RepID=A0A4U6QFX9_9ACTN|nr:glycosyltransferase family 2 protein [Nakamurella flava]TKV58909.1 glycosyltransferase family 2 protein [Nakamurella flava]
MTDPTAPAPPPGARAGEHAAGPADRVGIVVVTYSPGESLTAFLDSVPGATSRPVTVVMADNGSTDGSVERAAARDADATGGPEVRLLRTGGNLGYGRAANAGVADLGPAVAWVMVVNPDVVLGPGSVDELIAAAGRHPDAGAFGPLITTEDGVVYPSARALPSLVAGVGHAALGWWRPSNPWTRSYRLDRAEPVERTAGWLSGSCLLLRRESFAAVDGFDPGYFMYFEDVDLGERLARAGWRNVYVPSARVVHTGGHATEKAPALMADAHHRSAYRYLSRRYPARWQAPLRLVLRAGLALRAFLSRRSATVAGGAALPDRRVGPASGDR